ncbi:MAG: hypothetical protein PHH11_08315 [Methylomonas sp.]|nr:hypothetical protein [Methylomonas sp.]
MKRRLPQRTGSLIGTGVLSLIFSGMAHADTARLGNADWEITLSNAGYSDALFDQTPGYVGREYLSGEWGAAVGYSKNGATVKPTWLERDFVFPDWTTNSNFSTMDAIHNTVSDADGVVSSAASTIANSDMQIAQSFQVVDTLTGTPIGLAAASAGGEGRSFMSNRYVLMQSYSITNTSTDTLNNLQFFQLLHGMHSQAGVYDNRGYAGAYSDYRHDITLHGNDNGVGRQVDYISLSSSQAPTAFEIGHYGVEGNGIDDHSQGKPSVGTHISVEQNALNNNDEFAPENPWVAGAERWDMASLAPGETKTLTVMLSLLTGWRVDADTNTGIVNGFSNNSGPSLGSVGYEFTGAHSAGQFFARYDQEDADIVQKLIAKGEIGAPTFSVPGDRLQLFGVDFDGEFTGLLKLTFGFDSSLFAGIDESLLRVFQWKNNRWENLGGTASLDDGTITIHTDSLSHFAVAAVPVPGAVWLFGSGLLGLGMLRKRQEA